MENENREQHEKDPRAEVREPQSLEEIRLRADDQRAMLVDWVSDDGLLDAVVEAQEAAKAAMESFPEYGDGLFAVLGTMDEDDLSDPLTYSFMAPQQREALIAFARRSKEGMFEGWSLQELQEVSGGFVWFPMDGIRHCMDVAQANEDLAGIDPEGEFWKEEAKNAVQRLVSILRQRIRPVLKEQRREVAPALPERLRRNAEALMEMDRVVPDALREGVIDVAILEKIPPTKPWIKDVAGTFNSINRKMTLSASAGGIVDGATVVFHEYAHGADLASERLTPEARIAYLTAVASEPSEHSLYATRTFAEDGLTEGVQEDFAEALAYYFTAPEMLKDMTPHRYDAMEAIIASCFPEIDVVDVRKAIREQKRELFRDPAIARQEYERRGPVEIIKRFPSIGFEIPRLVTEASTEQSAEKRRTRILSEEGVAGEFVTEADVAKGRLLRKTVEYEDGKSVLRFGDPQYDGHGRVTSFHQHDGIHIALAYEGGARMPSLATIEADGEPVCQLRYDQEGQVIRERVGFGADWAEESVAYHIDGEGHVLEERSTLGGEPVHHREYVYAADGSLASETYRTIDGKEVRSYDYAYDAE